MEAKLLEGKFLAKTIQEGITRQGEAWAAAGLPKPKLAVLQVGEHPSSVWYVNQQEKLAAKLNLGFEKILCPTPEILFQKIHDLNQDESTHGVFITMPLPQGFDSDKVLLSLNHTKDVEGIHPASLGLIVLRKVKLIPPTAYAAFRLIESTEVELRGKRAVIVGQSPIVGRPLNMLLGERRVTTTICNTGTSEKDLAEIVGQSDIVIACAGKPGLVKGEWIREGAIVIDVGTTEVEGKLVGDVDFEGAVKRAGFITPVPGGVGPLTVTMLMQNLIHAYQWQKGR